MCVLWLFECTVSEFCILQSYFMNISNYRKFELKKVLGFVHVCCCCYRAVDGKHTHMQQTHSRHLIPFPIRSARSLVAMIRNSCTQYTRPLTQTQTGSPVSIPNNRRECRSRYSAVAVALRCSTNRSEMRQVHYCWTDAYNNGLMLCPLFFPNPFPSDTPPYVCRRTCLLPLLRPSDVYTRTSTTTSSTSCCGCCLPCFHPNAFHAVPCAGAAPIDISHN